MNYGDHNYKRLVGNGYKPGIVPRMSRYGDDAAYEVGLTPIEEASVDIIAWEDLKEAINQSRADRQMPLDHQRETWMPDGKRYNQNGIKYCWTWSGTAAVMDMRSAEGQETIELAPVSMGWLVDWKDRGNYLESFIKGAREVGVAPVEFVDGKLNSHNRNPRSYRPGWEEERKKFRLNETWDTDARRGDRNMIQQCATIFCAGRPLYVAYYWWGHAVEVIGLRWDESKQNNIVWQIRNSHNEDKPIELDGSRGIPDEAYGFVSSAPV